MKALVAGEAEITRSAVTAIAGIRGRLALRARRVNLGRALVAQANSPCARSSDACSSDKAERCGVDVVTCGVESQARYLGWRRI